MAECPKWVLGKPVDFSFGQWQTKGGASQQQKAMHCVYMCMCVQRQLHLPSVKLHHLRDGLPLLLLGVLASISTRNIHDRGPT